MFQVGKQIQESSGTTNLKRVSLELGQCRISFVICMNNFSVLSIGGKSPLIICEDADRMYEKALSLSLLIVKKCEND